MTYFMSHIVWFILYEFWHCFYIIFNLSADKISAIFLAHQQHRPLHQQHFFYISNIQGTWMYPWIGIHRLTLEIANFSQSRPIELTFSANISHCLCDKWLFWLSSRPVGETADFAIKHCIWPLLVSKWSPWSSIFIPLHDESILWRNVRIMTSWMMTDFLENFWK